MPSTQRVQNAQAGVIYGNASATSYEMAVLDSRLRRLDYVAARTPDGVTVLGQVLRLNRESGLSFEEALTLPEGDNYEPDEKISATVQVIGFRDDRDLLQAPRVPFRAGEPVTWAGEKLIQGVLGLDTSSDSGAYLGILKGTKLPVNLHINTLVQKHVSILAKTGAGKSYCTGVLMEELLKKGVALVIIDAHDEYHSLAHPNIAEEEVDRLLQFGLKPKAFGDRMTLWTTELNHRPDTRLLKLEGTSLSAADIMDLAGGALSGAQQGILYQAIKDARLKNPIYTLRDVIDMCHANKSNSKWNVISSLEALDGTGLFASEGIPTADLVQPGRASIVSLKGVPPEIQEVVVARLASLLFESRKSTEIPPFLFVVEEAHNYCPERGLGSAVSSNILRTIASEGRKFGMGLCVVSQRPAKVDKNVLSQCNTQIILKVTNPNDLKAIIGSVEGLTNDAADEIARLPVGVALVSGGSLGMPVLVEVRARQSRHGGGSVDVVSGGTEAKARLSRGYELADDDEREAAAAKGAKAARVRKQQEEAAGRAAATTPARAIAWGTRAETPAAAPPAPPPSVPAPAAPASPAASAPAGAASPPPPAIVARPPPSPSRPAAAPPPPLAVFREVKSEPEPRAGPPPDARATAEPRDVRIHRVANRVGYVATLKPEETLDLLRKAAARAGPSPNHWLDVFADVGRSHCLRDEPLCPTCPLAAKCAYKKRLDERRGGDGGRLLGRFFGKR